MLGPISLLRDVRTSAHNRAPSKFPFDEATHRVLHSMKMGILRFVSLHGFVPTGKEHSSLVAWGLAAKAGADVNREAKRETQIVLRV
jgi:hypothetical protein